MCPMERQADLTGNSRRQTVLVVDDEPVMQDTIEAILKGHGWRVLKAADSEAALDTVRRYNVDVVILDIDLPGSPLDGMDILEQIRSRSENVEVIMCTVDRNPRTAVRATKLGAFDYMTKDYEHLHDLPQVVLRALDRQRDRREILYLRTQVDAGAGAAGFVPPRSATMKDVLETVQRVANVPSTVLLLGESGTGKELLARILHYSSPRAERPFVAVNLAVIERNLMSSELFGHEKGAFTGADRQHIGRFELAEGGTLFLDEIGDLALDAQARLLRAIQERQIERVGGTAPIPLDLRLVVATNKDLVSMVETKEFREDLYYRINVVPVRVPPLRERRDDAPDLANFFARKYATLFHYPIPAFTDEAMATMIAYDWPGNVRELENMVQQILATRQGQEVIDESDLPALTAINRLVENRQEGEDLLRAATRVFERQLLIRALERCNWSFAEAARYLGVPHTTMKYKCKKHALAARPRGARTPTKPPK